jgi:glycine/D-amino acid oxidase-like deaminating enzyme
MTQVYSASQIPRFQGPAAWNALLTDSQRASVTMLDQNTSCDIAIIGTGFAGLAAARRLLQLEDRLTIIIVDATRVGEGGIGRNSGFMIDLPHDLQSEDYAGAGDSEDVLTSLNRSAIRFVADAVEEYGIDAEFFRADGKINGAASARGDRANRQYMKLLEQMNEPFELLDAHAMKELTGSPLYTSGVFTPGTALLQPAGYAHAVARGLQAQGVRIFENTPVTAFTKVSNGWQLSSPGGKINTAQIILANNGHLESFGFFHNRLMHISLFASMTRELDDDALSRLGGKANWGITPADPMGTTVRRFTTPSGGSRILTRTAVVLNQYQQSSPRQMTRARAMIRDKFDQRFPQLAGYPMEFSWAGQLCLSQNGVTVAAPLDDGVFAACVQNGLGAARGTLSGIAAAEYALGRKTAISAYFENQPEPVLLPPKPLANLGANIYLRWKEWIAGTE